MRLNAPQALVSCAQTTNHRENMLLKLVIGVHALASILLILFVLLHAGRGGGLSEMFGGGVSGGGMTGSTVVERNLDRITIATALTFTATTFALVFLMR